MARRPPTPPCRAGRAHSAGRPATFFLPVDASTDGRHRAPHRCGGAYPRTAAERFPRPRPPTSGCQPDRCKRASDAAHRRIHAHRFHDTGCVKLTQAQRDALIGAGYRLWTPPLTAGTPPSPRQGHTPPPPRTLSQRLRPSWSACITAPPQRRPCARFPPICRDRASPRPASY